MFPEIIAWTLSNFGLVMLIAAVILIIIHRLINKRIADAEIVYRWVAFFGLGITSIYAGIIHICYPAISALSIGWVPSPFQIEVGIADIAFGVLGILSFNTTYGFRLATVIGSSIFFLGDAINHIYQIIQFRNLSNGNAGSWLLVDILIPLILIICIVKLRPGKLMIREIRL